MPCVCSACSLGVSPYDAQTGVQADTAAADWIAAQPQFRDAKAKHADPLPEHPCVSLAKHLTSSCRNPRPSPAAAGPRRSNPKAFEMATTSPSRGGFIAVECGTRTGCVRVLTIHSPTTQGTRVAPPESQWFRAMAICHRAQRRSPDRATPSRFAKCAEVRMPCRPRKGQGRT
jgi:hypothetical protein